MFNNCDPAGSGLSVVCAGVDWPSDQDVRQATAYRLEDELTEVLNSLGVPATKTTLFDRYVYAQLSLRCPVCQCDDLEVGQVERPIGELLYLPVECRACDWTSRAVFSLIDYHDVVTLPDFTGRVTYEATNKYDSVNPKYYPYPRLRE